MFKFFAFNLLHNCRCHSLWELTDFVSSLAKSGTVVVFVLCINVLLKQTQQVKQPLMLTGPTEKGYVTKDSGTIGQLKP